MTTWTESTTVDGTVVRSRELASDARHSVSGRHQWVRTIHPYDLAQYHFAHSLDGKRWNIYRGTEFKGRDYGTPKHISFILRELDKSVAPHIDHS